MEKQRLDKFLANRGVGSRSQVRKLVFKGLVKVDGAVVTSPDHKVGEESAVEVEGRQLRVQKHVYIMLNKPAGVISATKDKVHRTALELVPQEMRRKGLFIAGRLDKDTEGFLLLTDDGDFAHRILSPRRHVPKRYEVRVDGPLEESVVEAFEKGVPISGDEVCSPAILSIHKEDPCGGEVVIFEGMYHQVKRMFEACGYRVTHLRRTQMGGLWLDETLAPGECRELTKEEVRQILDEESKA